jgi:sulfonate transport system ATP-binding protein
MSGSNTGIALSLQDITKTYGDQPVLHGINLAVERGQFIAIVGRSGCGKSTLLKLIAGLDKGSSGHLLMDGHPINGIHSDMRIMFQDSRLLPWKKVDENVRIGVKSGSKSEALEALSIVGLASRSKVWPAELSGGQRQRVALARALAGVPRLLLLDEPLGALDALTRIEMQQLIEELWRDQQFTGILVTHDVSEAVALADRVILIEQGRITMDVAITLARPRERDSGFAQFEKLILDRVMAKEQGDSELQKEKASYSI